ncbi:MAG: beta-propeller fold lactonase family protein [Nitrosopumilaceae archaeon]
MCLNLKPPSFDFKNFVVFIDKKTNTVSPPWKTSLTSVDKAAIGWSVAIVVIAIGITFVGQETPQKTLVIQSTPEPELFFTLQGEDSIGNYQGKLFSAGPKMTYLTISPDLSLILATSSGSDTVFAFDGQGNNLASIPVGKTPKGVKISPTDNLAFVANENSGTISVINTNSFSIIKQIQVGKIPHNIVFSSDGNTAYVTIQGGDAVGIIDVNSLELVDLIRVESLPHNLDLTPDDRYLLVTTIGTSDVAVIDVAEHKIIKRIPVSAGHHGIDVDPDGSRVYVSGIGSNLVNVIDSDVMGVIKTIPVGDGPHGLRTNLDGSLLYVGVTQTNELVVIDTDKLQIQKVIPVAKVPFWIAMPGNH